MFVIMNIIILYKVDGCVDDILIKFGVPKKLVRLINICLDGTQSKVRIGNYLSSSFTIENGLKHYYLILL